MNKSYIVIWTYFNNLFYFVISNRYKYNSQEIEGTSIKFSFVESCREFSTYKLNYNLTILNVDESYKKRYSEACSFHKNKNLAKLLYFSTIAQAITAVVRNCQDKFAV